MPSGNYKKISGMVENWLALNASPGFTFEPKTIFDYYRNEITTQDQKNDVMEVLWRMVNKTENLEKVGRLYKVIDNDSSNKIIDWVNADASETFPFIWPCSHLLGDNSSFFDCTNRITVSPGDLVVLGGETNKGKTAKCLNFVWDNMDGPNQVTLMGQEYYPSKFKRRVARMTWANPLDEYNRPKFELLRVRSDWQYMIRPDNINIIDWISLVGDFYKIGSIMEGIQSRLRKGIAIISLQKGEGKAQAVGGHFSEDLASVYITMHNGYCVFRKIKEWDVTKPNPNGMMFSYDIVGGTHFSNIKEVKRCLKCSGTGIFRLSPCDACSGKGVVPKNSY